MSVRKEEAIWAQRIDDAKDQGRLEGKEEGIKIGAERGKSEGEKQAKIAVAREMLADNMNVNTIAKFTRLPISKIEEIQKDKDFSG